MNTYELTTLLLSALGILLIPCLVYVIKISMAWSRVESKLDNVVSDMAKLVSNEDRIHSELLATMRDDRIATNARLRWIEENIWKRR